MPAYRLRSRLRVALGTLVALGMMSAAGATATAVVSRNARQESARFADAARKAVRVGQLAREQYIHEAHTLLVRDGSHLHHHMEWVKRLQEAALAFRPLAPAAEQIRLDRIAADSREIAELFAHEIVPAVLRSDQDAVRASHAKVELAVDRMTNTADEVAHLFERRAEEAEVRAERQSVVALSLVALTSALAVGFALIVARRLWSAFAEPVDALSLVAHRVADGDRDARMGTPPVVELESLARAFDGMLDALARKEAELRAADKLAALGRVAAGVAHEMNNPLAVIRGYLKTLGRSERDASVAEVLRTIDAEAGICQRIVEDLLTYARVPALTRATTDAEELVHEAALRCEYDSPHPRIVARVEAATLWVDPLRLRQILVNLLRNAADASADGPIEIVGRRGEGTDYELVVRDHGPGLSAEARQRLFEPFFTTRPGGTGLGLAVSYGLVAAHGGTLSVQDRAGGGTEISVHLAGAVRAPEAASASGLGAEVCP